MALARSPLAAEIRATLTVAAPLAAANIAQMAMHVTNAVMVGHLGAVSLAAAGLGSALYSTLLMTSQGVLTAVAPLAAHAIGADDHPTLGGVAGAGLIVAALLAAAFRARSIMVISLIAVPLNAALNWVLIFGHFGAPGLGILGSACATAIVQWLTLLCFAGYLLLTPTKIPVRIGRIVLREIPRILRLGLPIAALRGLEIGLFVTTGILMGLLGADALGAHQLVFNVAGVCFMVPLGLGQAATVRVAFQLGAGAPSAARRAGFVALALGALFMVAAAVVLFAAPQTLIGFYLDLGDAANRGLVEIALRLFLIAALFQVFDGVQVIAVGALRGYADTAVPMLIAAIGYWAIGFAGGCLLAFPLGYGAVGLWSGLALGLAVVAILLTLRLQSRARAHMRATGTLALAPSGLRA